MAEACVEVRDKEQRAAPRRSDVVRLLAKLERLPATAVGALVFQDSRGAPTASVLVEHGRVCWAVAQDATTRLSELFRRSAAGLDRASLEVAFRRCRADGRPFGEHLVAEGLVTEEALRATLLAQCRSALLAIAADRTLAPRWTPQKHARYAARFTFAPAEIFVGIGAAHGARTAALDAVIERLRHDTSCVVAAPLDVPAPLPVGGVVGAETEVEEVAELLAWAPKAFGGANLVDSSSRLVVSSVPDGAGLVATVTGEHFVAARCDDRMSLHRMLSRLVSGA